MTTTTKRLDERSKLASLNPGGESRSVRMHDKIERTGRTIKLAQPGGLSLEPKCRICLLTAGLIHWSWWMCSLMVELLQWSENTYALGTRDFPSLQRRNTLVRLEDGKLAESRGLHQVNCTFFLINWKARLQSQLRHPTHRKLYFKKILICQMFPHFLEFRSKRELPRIVQF